MNLTRNDVVLLFRIATEILDNFDRRRKWSGNTYRQPDVERLGGLVEFDGTFSDNYVTYGIVKITDAGWRRVAAEARRRVRKPAARAGRGLR